jgi:starch synthase
MNILFAASEMCPFASTGGLADVAQALPEKLAALGINIVRVVPCYRQVLDHSNTLRDTGIKLSIPVGLSNYTAEVWIDDSVYPLTYFIRRDEFYDRSNLYGLPHRDYDDNFERFTFFQKAVVALIDNMKLAPDIVHCNDWQTGLLPLFLRYGIHGSGREQHEKTIFTIHNLAYQGIYPGSVFPYSNLPLSCFNIHEMEYYNQVSCMKAGIVVSQITTTVSPSYAKEICTEESGCGLHGVLLDKGDDLIGILNGVDYGSWNPETDELIVNNYSADKPDGKLKCRDDLHSFMGLESRKGRPLIGMVTRLAEQKGLDILADAINDIMELDVAVAILGTGQQVYHDLCEEWNRKWPDRFCVKLEYNNKLAHRIEAGSDIFLMPSRFEPCGLNQMYSLKYGTVPVVHATGGLKDTITDILTSPDDGNGFRFDQYSGAGLFEAVKAAVEMYQQKPEYWQILMQRIMQQDFSWEKAASKYVGLYERCLNT